MDWQWNKKTKTKWPSWPIFVAIFHSVCNVLAYESPLDSERHGRKSSFLEHMRCWTIVRDKLLTVKRILNIEEALAKCTASTGDYRAEVLARWRDSHFCMNPSFHLGIFPHLIGHCTRVFSPSHRALYPGIFPHLVGHRTRVFTPTSSGIVTLRLCNRGSFFPSCVLC